MRIFYQVAITDLATFLDAPFKTCFIKTVPIPTPPADITAATIPANII